MIFLTSTNIAHIERDIYGKVIMNNKKVLLEPKRHTTRRVASTRCAALSGGGGVPTLDRGEVPTLVQGR